MPPREVDDLTRKMIAFLETGAVPDGLFAPDVFCDLSLPQWRIQIRGVEEVVRVRKEGGHPATGAVSRWRADPTPAGFVLEFEERWQHGGQRWYCREMLRADVTDGVVSEIAVYCTGDWDEARQREHARDVHLHRP